MKVNYKDAPRVIMGDVFKYLSSEFYRTYILRMSAFSNEANIHDFEDNLTQFSANKLDETIFHEIYGEVNLSGCIICDAFDYATTIEYLNMLISLAQQCISPEGYIAVCRAVESLSDEDAKWKYFEEYGGSIYEQLFNTARASILQYLGKVEKTEER